MVAKPLGPRCVTGLGGLRDGQTHQLGGAADELVTPPKSSKACRRAIPLLPHMPAPQGTGRRWLGDWPLGYQEEPWDPPCN